MTNLLLTLDRIPLCAGHTDDHFMPMMTAKKGKYCLPREKLLLIWMIIQLKSMVHVIYRPLDLRSVRLLLLENAVLVESTEPIYAPFIVDGRNIPLSLKRSSTVIPMRGTWTLLKKF